MFGIIAPRRTWKLRAASNRNSRRKPLAIEDLEERTYLTLQGNSLFPVDSPWNQRISTAPVAANSGTLVSSIGTTSRLHPDFGTVYNGGLIGIPYNVVAGTQPVVNVIIDAYADESDLLPVPIPSGAIIEGDPLSSSQNTGDRHLIVYDKDHNIAYELFNVHRPSETSDGRWHADSEAVWDMSRNSFRTQGDTSADAAGLPILPGLVRPDEVLDQGAINHALRFTVPRSANSYVFPASHQAGVNDASLPRMGERFRLKQNFDISSYSATNRVILQALKDYGMIVADNGSSWYLSGEPSSRWNDDELHALTQIAGSNFEAVNLAPILSSLDQTSGPSGGGTSVTIHGQGFSGAAGMLTVRFGTTPAASVSVMSDTTLIATSPAHAAGVVDLIVQTPYGTSATSAADRFTFTTATNSTVQRRALFYANSFFSDSANNPSFNNDTAVAGDKVALLPGAGQASFANFSSYTAGINGIQIDLSPGGTHASITANDFTFRIAPPSATNDPNGTDGHPPWAALGITPSVVVRSSGAGLANGSHRVELVWPNGAIKNTWLEVTVKANSRTGLGAPDIFYFGNRTADSGFGNDSDVAFTDSTDVIQARVHIASDVGVTNQWDFNKDGEVDSTDVIAARFAGNQGELDMINIANPPHAPATNGQDSGVASALAMMWGGAVSSSDGLQSSLIARIAEDFFDLPEITVAHIALGDLDARPARRGMLLDGAAGDQRADEWELDDLCWDWTAVDFSLE